jgi:multidrug transporter EmrE-like cation transporter
MNAIQSELLASGLDQSALHLLKYSQTTDSTAAVLGAATVGGLAYLALGQAMRQQGLGSSNLSWNLISSGLGVATGALVWGETFSNEAKLGIGLGLLSLYLINK